MNIAFIPVRGGSKSIPLKNIKFICGMPLVYWTVKAACRSKYVDKVYVSTDSEKIKETVNSFYKVLGKISEKLEVIERSEESASDTASTEFALLEFAQKYTFDNIILIQATSPLLQYSDIDRGFEIFEEKETDSVLSVVRQKRFHWADDENGFAHSTNYDVFRRPRRQEFEGCFVENGAFYITSKDRLISTKNRISGNIRMVEMSEDSFFEIDEPDDWIIIEALMKKKGITESFSITKKKKISNVKMFLTDCDGCLTDGGMYYSEHGDELKKFNTKDGMGFKLLREKGIVTGIITSEKIDLNRRRAEKLQLDILEAGCKDKFAVIKKICAQRGIALEEVVYIGDDINDVEAVEMVGWGCCPTDAVPQIKEVADYITKTRGGEGVIREVVDIIFK